MADSNSACDCCDKPPCPDPFLEYVSVQTTICAYFDDDDDTKKAYSGKSIADSGKTTVYSIVRDPTDGTCVETITCSGSFTLTTTVTADGPTKIVYIGDGSYTEGETGPDGVTTTTVTTTYNEDCSECLTASGSNSITVITSEVDSEGILVESFLTLTATLVDDGDCSGQGTWLGDFGGGGNGESVSEETRVPVISEPITTYSGEAELEFPEYPAFLSDSSAELLYGQGRSSSSFRSTNNEGAVFERKSKYRMRHLPTGTCYLKVWVSTIFTPLNGTPEAPVITSYTWTGSGNPCLKVPNDPVNATSQIINGEEATEVPVPATDGTNVATILKWSCVEGYEPDVSDPDNKQNNGFPNPTWEAAPP